MKRTVTVPIFIFFSFPFFFFFFFFLPSKDLVTTFTAALVDVSKPSTGVHLLNILERATSTSLIFIRGSEVFLFPLAGASTGATFVHPSPVAETQRLSNDSREKLLKTRISKFFYLLIPFLQMSVQRRDRPVREYSSAQVTARSVQEVPVSSSNGSYVDSRFNRKDNWEERNAASLPLKTKPTVYSSGHYVSKPQGNKTGSSGMGPGVCSQQIKPDYLCYNPVHYERERESEIAARIQNVDIRASSPEPRTDHTKVIPVGVNRTRTSENRRPPPPTRRVSSSIYISPSNPSNLRASTVDTYDPKTYRSSDSPKAPPSISISRPRHKVSYVGNLAQNSRPTTRDRSPSPARSADGMDSDYRARGSYGPRPAQYVPAPPYNPPHQREHLKSYSTSSLSRPWFQSGSTDDSYTNTSRDLRQIPARVITDRPVCEKCRCVPIDRRQRLCAGCQQELYQIHSNTARLY